jgi:hypothetical protein
MQYITDNNNKYEKSCSKTYTARTAVFLPSLRKKYKVRTYNKRRMPKLSALQSICKIDRAYLPCTPPRFLSVPRRYSAVLYYSIEYGDLSRETL